MFRNLPKIVNRRYTKLEPTSRRTLLKDIQNLNVRAEKDIAKELPTNFDLVIDGWSDMGTTTHYMASYAVCRNGFPLLAFSPVVFF